MRQSAGAERRVRGNSKQARPFESCRRASENERNMVLIDNVDARLVVVLGRPLPDGGLSMHWKVAIGAAFCGSR